MKIPSNNLWTQTNEGNKLGILRDTFNVNLQTPGQLIGAKKSVAFLHEDLQSDLSYALAIVYYAGDYIVITSTEAYKLSLTTTSATKITSYPSGVVLGSDAVVCYDRLYISLDTDLVYWNGSGWTTGIEALTTGVRHPMEVFDSQTTYKLAVANGSTVMLIDSAGNKSSTELTLPAQFTITSLRYRNGFLYIGTRNIYGGEARVFIWNGSGTSAQYEAPVGASWVFSMTPYLSSIACVTDKGHIMTINGSSAQVLASLPVAFAKNARWQDHLGLQLNGKVFNRGMEVFDDTIYINIDGEVDIGECLEMKSGMWLFNPNVGLYHHAQATSDRVRTDSAFTVSNSEITTAETHYLKTGDGVVFTALTSLTGVDIDKTYYVYVTAVNKFKLAHSRTALQAGHYITIGGSVSSETLLYAQNRDFGVRNHSSGAIGRIVAEERVPEMFAGDFMYGALVTNLDGTNKHTLQVLVDSFNVSRFATQRIYSDNIKQNWKEFYAFIDGVRLSNETLILKHNTSQAENARVISGVWLNDTTINCPIDGQDVTSLTSAYELIITDGYGRGHSTAVLEVTSTNSVYSVRVKDSLGTANKDVSFYFTPYKEQTRFTKDREDNNYLSTTITNLSSAWISLKSEMRGYQTEIAHLELPNAVQKKTK